MSAEDRSESALLQIQLIDLLRLHDFLK
jgi:hypothetical protein